MYYTIYRTINNLNGMIYIGKHQTINVNDGYMGSGKILQHALKKYGIKNFTKEILYTFQTEAEMNAKEKELVTEEFCLREDTYNICVGGRGGFSYINRHIGLEERLQRASNGGKNNKGRVTPHLKKLHESGTLDRLLFHNRIDFREIQNKGVEAAKSPKSIAKRKHTYKAIGHAKGQKNSQFGTMWITDGQSTIKVQKDSIIPLGWKKGRK